MRDVRRLVVAMSRARFGLYVFARAPLFANCFELTPTFSLLLQRPTVLHLLPKETQPTRRAHDDPLPDEPLVIQDMQQMASFVFDFYRTRVAAIASDPNVRRVCFSLINMIEMNHSVYSFDVNRRKNRGPRATTWRPWRPKMNSKPLCRPIRVIRTNRTRSRLGR